MIAQLIKEILNISLKMPSRHTLDFMVY